MTPTRKYRDDVDGEPETPLSICWCPYCRVYGACLCGENTADQPHDEDPPQCVYPECTCRGAEHEGPTSEVSP